jgi:hypothetical protein
MRTLVVLFLLLGLSTWSNGQELIRLRSGKAIEGQVKERRGVLIVTSAVGRKELQSQEVMSREPSAALREQFKSHQEIRPESLLSARLALANWCAEQGLTSGCIEELDGAILQGGLQDGGIQKLAKSLSADWQVHQDEEANDGRERREYIQYLFREYASQGLTQAAIAATRLQHLDEDAVFRLAMSEMKGRRESGRLLAANILATYRRQSERIPILYRRSLVDPSATVRCAATQSLAVTQDPVFARLYAKNLNNSSQAVRLNAADALGNLGLKEGIEPLIGALKSSLAGSGGSPVTRGHIIVTTQRAYVKDFDVEVAQGAVIADPIVDIVQEGAVLDVGLVAVSIERGYYSRALRRLAGVDFGARVAEWDSWLKANPIR